MNKEDRKLLYRIFRECFFEISDEEFKRFVFMGLIFSTLLYMWVNNFFPQEWKMWIYLAFLGVFYLIVRIVDKVRIRKED